MTTHIRKILALIIALYAFSGYSSSELICRTSLEQAFAAKAKMVDELVVLLKPSAEQLVKKLQAYGYCEENAKNKNWLEWRESNKTCGMTQSRPDDFRRFVVREIENVVARIMIDTQMIPQVAKRDLDSKISSESLRWIAIGTPGPNSDIDTVGILDDEIYVGFDREKYLPKVVAEVRAKSLFDALGMAIFNVPLSVVFDTESYIDVTDDLHKSQYQERIQKPEYQNLAITLAFVQLARQLHHPIENAGTPIYDYSLVEKVFNGSNFLPLLKDAERFSDATFPKSDPGQNIRTYIPLINHLALEASKRTDEFEISKIKGILGTYFPEAYYTREALAHVCYSDDDFSQLMLTLIAEYFRNGEVNEVPIEKIDEFKRKTITPNAFVFAVSNVENLGYFFHRLNRQEDHFQALKNAAKYFFRIARALAGYWKVAHLDSEKVVTDNKEQRYVRKLYFLAEKLERLKRGYVPFASPAEAREVIQEVNLFIKKNRKAEEIQKWADELYSVHSNRYLSSAKKKERVAKIARNFDNVIGYDDGKFELKPIAEKNESSAQLLALFELVANVGSNSQNTNFVKQKIEAKLRSSEVPRFSKNKTKSIGDLNPVEFTAFLQDLVEFTRHTLEDFSRTRAAEPELVNLAQWAEQLMEVSGK